MQFRIMRRARGGYRMPVPVVVAVMAAVIIMSRI
jgi:hypothetical protein